MSSKFCISINERKKAFSTKDKASKIAAKGVTKKKALKNDFTVLDCNSPPNRCEKNQSAEASFLVVQSSDVSEFSTIDYQYMLADSLSGMKEWAANAETTAGYYEKTVQSVKEMASKARFRAEMYRKIVDDKEKSIKEASFLESYTSYCYDTLPLMKNLAENSEKTARMYEERVESAKEMASKARCRAEMLRKMMFADTLPEMKKSADLAEESARNYESVSSGMTILSI